MEISENLCSKPLICYQKSELKFVHNNDDFLVTVIVITEFDLTTRFV